MQRILVKKRNKDGEEVMMPFEVIRSWSQSGSGDIFLFRGGDYGYRSGDPVRTRAELEEVVADPGQKRQALNWWDRKGKVKAQRFYEHLSSKMDRRAELDQRAAEGLDPENLEGKLYRVSVGGNVTDEAATWHEAGLSAMPTWWGQAEMIKIGDTLYELTDALDDRAADPDAARKPEPSGRKSAPKPGAKPSTAPAPAEEL